MAFLTISLLQVLSRKRVHPNKPPEDNEETLPPDDYDLECLEEHDAHGHQQLQSPKSNTDYHDTLPGSHDLGLSQMHASLNTQAIPKFQHKSLTLPSTALPSTNMTAH